MSQAGVMLVLAVFSPLPRSGGGRETGRPGVALPERTAGGVTARLWVQVPEQPAAPGLAQTLWALEVEGPPGLEIDGPRLEDALDGWRRTAEASSWAADGRERVEVTWRLVQAKPGVMPLPGVTLRVRPGPGAAWEELSWHELLQEPRDVPPPVALPPLPAPIWPRALATAGIALAAAVSALLALRVWRRWRAGLAPPLTPRERALQALRPPELPGEDRPGERFAHVSAVLRDFLERQLGVPATRRTTEELVAALGESGLPAERAREVLEFCDLVKFAGRVPEGPAGASALDGARELIAACGQERERGGPGKEAPVGEGG